MVELDYELKSHVLRFAGEIAGTKGTLMHIGPVKNRGKDYMIIYFSTGQPTENDLKIFNQILSTFKFLD